MTLELETVLNNPGEVLPFALTLPASYNLLPFAQPPQITGQAANRAGIVTLEGQIAVQLRAQCDRCAEPFVYEALVYFAHTLVTEREHEENDELILVESRHYDPTDLLWEDIVLAMPPKMLCRAECKGLCPQCGQNLNEGLCNCKPEGDPRWEALSELMQEEPII